MRKKLDKNLKKRYFFCPELLKQTEIKNLYDMGVM